MNSSGTIAVLGLGRMGAAIAARLMSQGWEVTGWTRSGRAAASVAMADGPDAAVKHAGVVLLALFDGPACMQVLDPIRDSLRPDTIVVNTSTIAPAEAAVLARRVGACYVHAPLLGSVPAVTSGTLEILAGADDSTLARIRPLLDALGTVHEVRDAATAAALKLVANKDMALLADASHSPLRSAAELADSPAGPQADIALAAMAQAVGDDVLAPLRAYIRGHATGDPAHFREAFLPTAHIEGIREGTFVSWRLDEYCALFHGHPAPDEPERSRRIDAVDVHGTVATATMTLWHAADTFTDIFLLVRADGRWRIANKAYHRH